jgi:ligand-binding sensor domain-containing protein/signal transduction histidine kinase
MKRVGLTCAAGLLCLPLLGVGQPAPAPATQATLPQAIVEPRTLELPVADAHDIRFARLGRDRGLSQTRVTQIVQDNLGFMWFGTQYGLDRYDGYRFKVFVHERTRPNSLGCVHILALFKDHTGRLWVGCAHSLDRLDPATELFEHFRIDTEQPGDPDITVHHISEDHSGMLWLSTHIGVYRLDPATGKTTHFRHEAADPNSLSSDEIKSTGEDRHGAIWVADATGLEQFDPQKGVQLRIELQEPRELSFQEDSRGVFWILYSSGNGLASFDRATRRLTRYSFNDQRMPGGPLTGVISLVEDSNRTLWLGTLSDGILKFDSERKRLLRYRNYPAEPTSLAEDRVTQLYEDREGNMWAGLGATEPNLFSIKPPPFGQLPRDPDTGDTLGESLVNALYEDRDGYLWIGMTGTLKRLDRGTGQYLHVRIPPRGPASDIISIAQDSAGAMWLGTSGQGLFRLDPATGVLQRYRHEEGNPASLSEDVVQRLLIDHTGTLWAGTWDGLDRFDAATGQFKTYRSDARARGATPLPLAEDASGYLWLPSSSTAGLLRFDPRAEHFELFQYGADQSPREGNDRVNTIHVSGPEALWWGTQNGLYRLNPRTRATTAWFVKDGLPSNAVGCILEDEHGRLWIGTNQGIARFNTDTQTFKRYSVTDGLPGPDLTGWWACHRNRRGEMFLGGFHGATVFDPDRIGEDTYTPPVVLTDFTISGTPAGGTEQTPLNQAIAYATERTLSPYQSSFSVEFAALSYRSPLTNRYRYELEGLDATWHEVQSDRRMASYTTLPPGIYTFRAQAATSRGPWSEPGATLRILIPPPWWSTWWFRALALGLLIVAIVVGYRLRMSQLAHLFNIRMNERIAERTRIARELHDSLLQGFQGILFRLQAVHSMLPARPDDARAALDTTLDRADATLAEGREAVQGLRSTSLAETDFVQALIALGEELVSATSNPAAHFRVVVEGKPRQLALNVSDEFYRIAREAIRNAFQHSGARAIEAEVSYSDKQFCIRVRDNGAGLDPNILQHGQRPGHWGIPGIRERAARLGAQLNIWSDKDAGTEIEAALAAKIAYARDADGPL